MATNMFIIVDNIGDILSKCYFFQCNKLFRKFVGLLVQQDGENAILVALSSGMEGCHHETY
ncbi:hypothetical protein [Alkalihalobacillus sp. R86527]|uniref:hypothetical protein n=1 Tax=Alkalihalobacillus sp. R86527 TaxID=3093863 RepID=UPI00366DFFDB